MNDIVYTKSYEDYKLEVGTELSKASESFVRIGYLLKVARDTTILQGTEYEGNYVKFAEAEFGLEKTQVSRFIRINDKFSVNGNSPELIEQYKGFGTRKLGIMLMLPNELNEELTPDFTVEDIEELKNEIKEEDAISPLEQYAEKLENENFQNPAAEKYEESILEGALFNIMKERPDLFVDLATNRNQILKVLAPIKEQTYITRISGVGRVMVIFHETEVAVVNARTSEKAKYSLQETEECVNLLFDLSSEEDPKELYAKVFGVPFPEEPKIEKNESKEIKKPKKDSVKTTDGAKRIQNGAKDAKKKQSKKAATDKHEETDEGNETDKTTLAAGETKVEDLQQEGCNGENQLLGETDLGGTEGESLPPGAGETLPGEGAGAASGEGSTSGTPERNKYTGKLEQLEYSIGKLKKDIAAKDGVGMAAASWLKDSLESARLIEQCIQSVIKELENEQNWREIE